MKSRLPKGYGSGQATNMSQIAKQAQKIQEEMEKVSAELDQKEYTVSTGGNAVTVTMLGKMEITNLSISPGHRRFISSGTGILIGLPSSTAYKAY